MTTDTAAGTMPAHWSPAARDAVDEVLDVRADLSGADLAALSQAAELITAADGLDEVAREAGYVSTGSTGQVIAHPAAVEARLSRTAAATILARLAVPGSASGALTSSQRGRAAAAARWSRR